MSSAGSAPLVRVGRTLLSAGRTDAGRQREVNEDRLCFDAERGIFGVIDGVGGQAAGGKAADVALALIKETLGREAGSSADRLRAAITDANNEIYRLAATRAEWDGMACVLTVALVNNGTVTFGHVGDSRLYKLRGDRIDKLTRDHSPVGEREDANEITERQAMLHPRRNEVYRDVGSEFHDRRDRDFIDIRDVLFESDAALLLCSDGLTDLVDSMAIARTVSQHAGDPDAVVRELIAAANAAGGKDNVTVVYVEGETFATSNYGHGPIQSGGNGASAESQQTPAVVAPASRRLRKPGLITLAAGIATVVGLWSLGYTLDDVRSFAGSWSFRPTAGQRTVAPGESINEAMRDAPAGTEIVVEPGEYREQVTLVSGVRLVSRVPRAATIRLPAGVRDAADVPAVLARNVSGVEVVGFRISGDSATPLPFGILVQNSTISLVNIEIAGASRAAVEFAGGGASALMASDIRDNPGSAVVVRDGDRPRIAHNAFSRNGMPDRRPIVVERGQPSFSKNVFVGVSPESLGVPAGVTDELRRDNWFVSADQPASRR